MTGDSVIRLDGVGRRFEHAGSESAGSELDRNAGALALAISAFKTTCCMIYPPPPPPSFGHEKPV